MVIVFALCSFEASHGSEPKAEDWVIAAVHQSDAELGYSGIPGAAGIDSLSHYGKVVYRINLALDEYGFRPVPGRPKAQTSACVVTIGDSIPFGIGVEASETVAARLQASLGDKVRVFNFGYTGYGPHQTLRFLEIGRERPLLVGCRKTMAFQFFMADHPQRAVGRSYWGLSSPRYRLSNGIATYAGPRFPDWLNRLNNSWSTSRIWQDLFGYLLGYGRKLSAREERLYRAMLNRTQEILKERYAAGYTGIFIGRGQPANESDRRLHTLENAPLVFEEMVESENILREFYLEDETHLNSKGHAVLTDRLLERIRPWLEAP